jgi:hypothetical protein
MEKKTSLGSERESGRTRRALKYTRTHTQIRVKQRENKRDDIFVTVMFTLSAPSSLVAFPARRGGGGGVDASTTSRRSQSSGRRNRRRRVASSRGDKVVEAMAKKGSKSSNDEPEGFGFPRYLRLLHSRQDLLVVGEFSRRERGFLSVFLASAAFAPSERESRVMLVRSFIISFQL